MVGAVSADDDVTTLAVVVVPSSGWVSAVFAAAVGVSAKNGSALHSTLMKLSIQCESNGFSNTYKY